MNTSNVKETLRRLGIDQSIDTRLDKMMSLETASFTIIHALPPEVAAGMEYHLHFFRQHPGDYALKSYDAYLFRTLHIPYTTINGISIKELEDDLKLIDWHHPINGQPPKKQKTFSNALENIEKLCETDRGLKIAKLLVARHCPNAEDRVGLYFPINVGFERAKLQLLYGHERDQYYLKKTFTADEAIPVKQAFTTLVKEADMHMPHLYRVELTVMSLNTGRTAWLHSKEETSRLGPAGQLFNSISFPHFDKERMQQEQYPYVVTSAQIVDKIDDLPLITKKVRFEKETNPANTGINIDLEINDQKMDALQFYTKASVLFPMHPEELHLFIDIKDRFARTPSFERKRIRKRSQQDAAHQSGRPKRPRRK